MSNIEITKLSNGISLISEHLPYVKSFSLGFWFKNGSRNENKLNNGVSHFIEHMVFKGTSKRSSRRIAEEIESVGGYLNAFTSKEHTCFYGRGLYQNFSRTFDVLSDIILNPLFRDKDIKKESGVVLDELNDIMDNPDELIFDLFEEKLFDNKGLGLPVIGTEENILKFDNHFLIDFYDKHYRNGEILIVASGFISHKDLVSCAEKYFSNIPTTKYGNTKSVNKTVRSNYTLEKDFQQVHCILGKEAYGYKSEKRIPQLLLSNLLGEGSSSRLFQAVREKQGITYQVNSFINSFSDIASCGIYFSTSERNLNKVLSIINKETEKVLEKEIKTKELDRVKSLTKGGIVMSLENTTNRMIRIANSILNYNRIISLEEIFEKIDRVTIEEIKDIGKELIIVSDMNKVVICSSKNSKIEAA